MAAIVSPLDWPKVESDFRCFSCGKIFIFLFENPDNKRRYCNRCRDAVRGRP
jgi:hypothetical protein